MSKMNGKKTQHTHKHNREVGTVVIKELLADFEVLSEIDKEELAGAIAAEAAVVRWPPELK